MTIRRFLVTAAALLAVAAVRPAPAAGQSMIRFLELDQRLVRAQLDQELQAYLRARTREDSAAADVAEA
ncbi:MAG: hypothetical protein PVG07_12710, partial [Acidobacteriota bacterium]